VFGREGDAWVGSFESLTRLTTAGQQTLFPFYAYQAVVAHDGDIWATGSNTVKRLVPGAPGLDLWGVAANPATRTVRVRLACGGSSSGCRGTLRLALDAPSAYRRRGGAKTFTFVRVHYVVAAESRRTLKVKVPAKVFGIGSLQDPEPATRLIGTAHATVAGGPTLDRRIRLAVLAQDS
jgi:hypothetical protein